MSPEPVRPTPALVCLDMAGTTVSDDGLVEQAFDGALDALGVATDDSGRPAMVEYVRATMGTSKIEVFRFLFGDEGRAAQANQAFEAAYDRLLQRGGARPIPGSVETVGVLRGHGTKVALTTGFSPRTRDALLAHLGWAGLADLVLSPADAGRGRPFPDMNLTALLTLGVDDVRSVAVVGDTASDMESGRRAGASWVVGVLTGAHDAARLTEAGATHVVDSVAGLPGLLGLGS